MRKITKPEPSSRTLIQSWARIYSAILDADNREIDLAFNSHIELFPNAIQQSVGEWSGEILNRALSMKQEDLKVLHKRCLNYRRGGA